MHTLFEDTRIVFTAAILASLAYPNLAQPLQWLITPSLVVAMTLALRNLDFTAIRKGEYAKPVFTALSMHYVVQNVIILSAAFILVKDFDYLAGFIVMAAVPPAVSVVPFTYLLEGDYYTSTIAEVLAYLISLVFTPLLIMVFLGSLVNISYLLQLLVVLIVLPMAVSRVIARVKSGAWKYSKSVITLSFGLITYLIVGLNHETITSTPMSLTPVLTVVILKTFISATMIYHISKKLGAGHRAITYTLFTSHKNNGAAAVMALTLISVKAALPMAFAAIAEVTYIILLQQIAAGSGRSR
jgi:predicted Na+-dependent transporter